MGSKPGHTNDANHLTYDHNSGPSQQGKKREEHDLVGVQEVLEEAGSVCEQWKDKSPEQRAELPHVCVRGQRVRWPVRGLGQHLVPWGARPGAPSYSILGHLNRPSSTRGPASLEVVSVSIPIPRKNRPVWGSRRVGAAREAAMLPGKARQC